MDCGLHDLLQVVQASYHGFSYFNRSPKSNPMDDVMGVVLLEIHTLEESINAARATPPQAA